MDRVINTRLTIQKLNKDAIESIAGIFFGLPKSDNKQLITDLSVLAPKCGDIEDGDIFRIDNLYGKTVYVKIERDIIEIGSAVKLKNNIMICDDVTG